MGFDLGPAPEKQDTTKGGFDIGAPPGSNAPAPVSTLSTEKDRKLLDTAPDESELSGGAKNLATGTIKGVAHAPGMGGDVGEFMSHVHDMAMSRILGIPMEQIRARRDAERAVVEEARKQSLKLAPGGENPERPWETIGRYGRMLPAGHDISSEIAKKTGEYEPTSELGKYGQLAAEGAGALATMSGPGGALATARNVLAGASSGPAGKLAHDLGAPPEVEFGASMLAPYAVTGGFAGVDAARKRTFGMTKAEEAAAAAKLLKENTADPEAALAAAKARTGMPDETLAEATLDPAQAKGQEALLTRGQADMSAAAHANRTGRNAQLLEATRKLAPEDADAANISKGFHEHRDALLQAAENTTPPPASPANVSGEALQEAINSRNKAAKTALDKLEESIDPDRKMNSWTGDLADHATAKLAETKTRPEQDRSAVADDYLTRAANFGDVKKFRDLIDFDRSLTSAITQAKGSDPIAYRELTILKGRVKDAISKSVENQHKTEQGAVVNGTLSPEDTFGHRLQREQADFYERTGRPPPRGVEPPPPVDEVNAAGDRRNAGSVQEPVPGSDQGARPAGEVLPSSEAPTGSIPGGAGQAGEGAQGADAAARLKLFNQGHGTRKDTFENGPAGAVANTELGADAAAKAFTPGPKGYEVGKAVLAAGGPEALTSMKDIATGRLQAELKGKPLDQKTLDAWKTKHTDALRAIDEAEAKANPGQNIRFSDSFNDAASARQAVNNFENSAAAEFLGRQRSDGSTAPLNTDAVISNVGAMMKHKDGAQRVTQLLEQADQAPNGEAIKAGIRRAAANWIEQEFTQHGQMLPGDTGPVPVMSGTQLKDYMAKRRDTLEAMFEPEAVKTMDKLADAIDRSITVRTTASRLAGSQTAERTQGLANLNRQLDAVVRKEAHEGMPTGAFLNAEAAMESGRMLFHGDPTGAFIVGTLAAARHALAKAFRDRGVRSQANIANLIGRGFASRDVGAAMLENALHPDGTPNLRAFDNLARAMLGAEDLEHQQERTQHAAGGSVFDHSKAARHMVGLVDKARKSDATLTKPLLKTHDNVIAHALAIANRSI